MEPIKLTITVCALFINAINAHGQSQSVSNTEAENISFSKSEISFELFANEIFVKASLNGKPEYFILDNGAPDIILNANNEHITAMKPTNNNAYGVGGNISTGKSHVDAFDWGGINKKNFDAITVSLGHLERKTQHNFAGLIGYAVFKDYEMIFDYKHKKILLAKPGAASPQAIDRKPICTIHLDMKMHIPTFTMRSGNTLCHMGLDWGASSNLLSKDFLSIMADSIVLLQDSELDGAGKQATNVPYGILKSALINNVSYNDMPFAFDDRSLATLKEGYGLSIDGLLGYEFLKRHITSVNFAAKELKIYAD